MRNHCKYKPRRLDQARSTDSGFEDILWDVRVLVLEPATRAKPVLEAVRDGRAVHRETRKDAVHDVTCARESYDVITQEKVYRRVSDRPEVALARDRLREALAVLEQVSGRL